VNAQAVTQGVLVVKGVREDGLREFLAVEVADTENAVTCEDLFRRLKDCGLHLVRLVTSDDHRGLVKAIRKHFQGVSWQRCQVHVARNAVGKVGGKCLRAISADVRAVVNFPEVRWRCFGSTSGLERFNQELRRRTRVVRIFPNPWLRRSTPACGS